jgi:dinuclear metal center YbgI/SA1388 family protein
VPTVDDIVKVLDQFAPPELAADWDNVGLLVGDRARSISRVMTCLTLTPTTVREAVDRSADLVVVHHPLPFHPLKRLTSDTPDGRMLLALIGAQIAVYSPHTAFDSAASGINQRLAEGLGLQNIEPLVVGSDGSPEIGAGRCGMTKTSATLGDVAARVKSFLKIDKVRVVGNDSRNVRRVAFACGSGGSFLAAAEARECDILVTGETSFHTCLHAEAIGLGLILVGHYASERFGMEFLAEFLGEHLVGVEVWASREESDPIRHL